MSEGFAYGGSVVVSTDGAEILVYDAHDEAPRWRKTLAAPVADVAAVHGEIVAIDAKGRIERFAAAGGEAKARASVDGAPRAIDVSDSGAIAVALAERVVVVDGDAATSIDLAGARALAWDGARLAIGTDGGKVVVLEGDRTIATGDVGDPVRGVARRHGRGWLATAGDRVAGVDAEGRVERLLEVKDGSPSAIACSLDGALAVLKVARNKANVVALGSRETIASIVYAEREIARAAIADDGRFVWIGLVGGDANKIDLDSEDVYRTDPHEGRERRRWIVRAKIDKRARARVKASVKPVAKTPAKRPPKPPAPSSEDRKARQHAASGALEPPQPTGPREPQLPPSPPSARNTILAVLAVTAIIALATLKCG
jgi:hypothetical protein